MIIIILFVLVFQYARSALPATVPDLLFRKHVDPDGGGKIPESAHLRKELNELDSMGFANNEATANAMVDAMQDMPLPESLAEAQAQALALPGGGGGPLPAGPPAGPHSPSLPFATHTLATPGLSQNPSTMLLSKV